VLIYTSDEGLARNKRGKITPHYDSISQEE
jgi:hypothetical protein